MIAKGPYIVLVNDLPTERRFEIAGERVSEWLKGHPMREALGAPEADPEAGHGSVELDLSSDDTNVFASGHFKGEVTVACSRCVEAFKIPIDEHLQVTFMPAKDMPPDDDSEEGVEVDLEALDVFPFDGETIDVEALLREQFVLAVPFAPLCREDCKGLCPQCGIDRNTATCTCERPIDPRLAGLKGLKLPS